MFRELTCLIDKVDRMSRLKYREQKVEN